MLLLCSSVRASRAVASALQDAGIPASLVTRSGLFPISAKVDAASHGVALRIARSVDPSVQDR